MTLYDLIKQLKGIGCLKIPLDILQFKCTHIICMYKLINLQKMQIRSLMVWIWQSYHSFLKG